MFPIHVSFCKQKCVRKVTKGKHLLHFCYISETSFVRFEILFIFWQIFAWILENFWDIFATILIYLYFCQFFGSFMWNFGLLLHFCSNFAYFCYIFVTFLKRRDHNSIRVPKLSLKVGSRNASSEIDWRW